MKTNPDNSAEVLPHLVKQLVNLVTMRNFSTVDYLKLRKYDGELCGSVKIAGATFLAEFMRTPISGHFYTASDREMFARWPGGWWAVLTVMEIDGKNMLADSTYNRWGYCQSFSASFTPDIILAEKVTDMEACMAAGAEGVCAHAWDAPWGTMFAHKASGIYICEVVMEIGGTQSVGIAKVMSDELTAMSGDMAAVRSWLATRHSPLVTSPCGRVKLGGGKCDQVRVGSIIRVEAMGETDSGKLRQPVPCREWKVKV